MYLALFTQKRVMVSLLRISQITFLRKAETIDCAVKTESLNIIHVKFIFPRVSSLPIITLRAVKCSRSQWPRGLRRRSAAERLLGSWVRIPTEAWMFVFYECLCCQVEVSATGRSLVQRSPTDRCVFECDKVKIKQPRHLLWVGRRRKDYDANNDIHVW
jgi:hypothetical protein